MKNYFQGKKKIIIYALFILLGVFLSAVIFWGIEYVQISEENKIREEVKNNYITKTQVEEKKHLQKKEIVDSLVVEAGSFLVKDIESGVEIFSKNKNKIFGIASLTKIATADIYLESIKGNKDTKVIILKKNLAKAEDNGLKWGEKFEGKELVKFMMAVSSNDAASSLTNNLGGEVFIKKMNVLAENLELNSTLFFSESGLDVNTNILGSYSNATNISKLAQYFYKKYAEFSAEFSVPNIKICSEKLCHNIENTNDLLFEKISCTELSSENTDECLQTKTEKYPYKILFSKTGYTKKSGGSIVMIAEISGRKIMMVVLNSGKGSRFTDIKNISESVEKYLKIK